jgi:COMPASS component SPP1
MLIQSRRKPNTARARPRPKVAATSDRKASSQKKSLLVQAQENRARIVQAQAAQEKATADNAAPKDEEREYCVCKSRYDEERAMIGCDRCDEWYHPLCVGLEDSDVDQIDLYVCPACRKRWYFP